MFFSSLCYCCFSPLLAGRAVVHSRAGLNLDQVRFNAADDLFDEVGIGERGCVARTGHAHTNHFRPDGDKSGTGPRTNDDPVSAQGEPESISGLKAWREWNGELVGSGRGHAADVGNLDSCVREPISFQSFNEPRKGMRRWGI